MAERQRCAYLYASGDQCVWEGPTEMCSAHRLIVRANTKKADKRAKAKARYAAEGMPEGVRRSKKKGSRIVQPSRVQSARAIIDRLPEVREPLPRDPTAPWCTCNGGHVGECGECGRPTYARYMTRRSMR